MHLLNPDNFKHHIDRFNTMEPEGVVNLIPNAQSWDWIKSYVPFFSCPDANLEEIYYYKIDRPEGYAIQRVYTPDGRIDQTLTVRDGELVLIPEGYHPVVAAHGYNVYYLNALAGSARSMAASDDPAYAWVRQSWTEKDPRVPLVKGVTAK